MRSIKKYGFTLIELLLGLTLFSLVLLTLYSTFYSGIRLSRQTDRQGNVYREARWALTLIERELENMVGYDYSGSYEGKYPFMSSDGRFSFILASPQGLKVITYYVLRPDEGDIFKVIIGETYAKNVSTVVSQESASKKEAYLIREEKTWTDFINDTQGEDAQKEIIAGHLTEDGLRISFGYSVGEDSKETQWKESWDGNYIPSMVKIEMDFILPGEDGKTVTLTKDVLIPSGFLGADEAS